MRAMFMRIGVEGSKLGVGRWEIGDGASVDRSERGV